MNEHAGLGEPRPVKVWAGIILFFGLGVAIALTVAYSLLDRGSSVGGAIAFGAGAGAFGAWFVLCAVVNTMKRVQRRGK